MAFMADLLLHSMIGYWHYHDVRLCLYNAVHCGCQSRCTLYRAKSCISDRQASKFLFVSSDSLL